MRLTLAALTALLAMMLMACERGTTAVERSAAVTGLDAPATDRARDDDDDERALGRAFHVSGSLSDGGTFTGKIRFREFNVENDQLIALGEISGRARRADGRRARVDQTFKTPVKLTTGGGPSPGALQVSPAQARQCSVLLLQLGVIRLNVLGSNLQLNVSLISIDLTAAGLLGSLLCGLLLLQL
jgi:hypothetical protein